MKKKLVVIGAGFAGFWSALSAVRQSRALQKQDELEISMINPDEYLTIRPRLYEASLEGLRIELAHYTKPLGIRRITGYVNLIDPASHFLYITSLKEKLVLNYDYLVLAAGSTLQSFDIPGMELTYNIDTFAAAKKLENHMIDLAGNGFRADGSENFVIVGGGLTGIEAVTGIIGKAEHISHYYLDALPSFKAIVIERKASIASEYSIEARKYIQGIISFKNIEVITGTAVSSIEPRKVHLSNGMSIPTQTVIWTAGMQASRLTEYFYGERDMYGRLKVDQFLKLPGYTNVIVAGDAANVTVDNGLTAPMAFQYSNFQGRWAGHNAVNDMFGMPLEKYIQEGYVTCLDLGHGEALFTRGWERALELTGSDASKVKTFINTQLIYPPADAEDAVTASYPEIPEF
ncbi:NAD(P)/FAD-dependent oxidoreductase [Mucilaginibacter endophyticus]|uniref:NAD(P)/FAD-dependent oxidoreductase n=1 Tax=Mucilaginibacter endophyticus TaxID=2675003 RepID=UPI000E0D9E16|nr:FAD-dependent oxidoreductase [Mucilaginibacter endophyticus]